MLSLLELRALATSSVLGILLDDMPDDPDGAALHVRICDKVYLKNLDVESDSPVGSIHF